MSLELMWQWLTDLRSLQNFCGMTAHSRVSSFLAGAEEVAVLGDSFWVLSGSLVTFLPMSLQAPMPPAVVDFFLSETGGFLHLQWHHY